MTLAQNNDVIAALADALSPHLKETASKHTTPTGTPSAPYLHGPGGLFGVEGVSQDLFHTRLSGRGLAWVLPTRPSVYTHPLFGYISGFQNETGSEKDGVCDDPPIAGAAKTCLQTAPFGRYERMSREMEINRVGQRLNRGEFDDLRLLNDPMAPELGQTIFPNIGPNMQLRAGAEVLSRMLEVGVTFVNLLGRQLYTGDPTNNSAGQGYEEFMGLDLLIGTNKVDAKTGTSCPSLYSDVKDYNYQMVDEEGTSPDIVTTLTALFRHLEHIASRTNASPVKWVISMRKGLFDELVDIWPCRYASYRCDVLDGDNIDAEPNIETTWAMNLRQEMRNGKYLKIDGQNIPVITDDFIVEESSGDNGNIDEGGFASDIYVVPLTVRGGTPATFFQYFDYSQGTQQSISNGRLASYFWSDGGRFMWHQKPPKNWCIQFLSKIEPRIVMRMPHLAGRLTNVQYSPLQHDRDVHPDDPYHVDGGQTGYESPSLYADWNLPG